MPIIAPIPRTERRLMQKTIHKTRDKNHARRLTAMLSYTGEVALPTLPEHFAVRVHPSGAGLTGLPCMARKA